MSDEFTTPGENSTSGSSLRAALEAQIARTKQVEAELAALKEGQTKQEIEKAWEGVPDQYRVAYAGDEDPNKIRAWWDAAKPLFGVNTENGEQTPEAPAEETPEQAAERAEQQAFQAAAGVGSTDLTTVQAGLSKAMALRDPQQNSSGRITQADVDEVFKGLNIPK